MKTSPTFLNVTAALLKAQAQIAEIPIIKDASNPDVNSKYIQLGSLLNIIKPILQANELVLVQGGGDNITDGLLIAISVESTLIHSSGEWLSNAVTVPLVGRKKRKEDGGGTHAPDAQSGGGALTYGQRYGIVAFFALAIDKDDDGARASLTRRRTVAKRIANPDEPKAGEWTEAGVMPYGTKMGTPLKDLTPEFLRAELARARKDGKLEAATIISKELTNRVVPIAKPQPASAVS